MRSDMDVKREAEAELRAHPDIDASDIAVAVKNGVVILSGYVRSYCQKWEAERDPKRYPTDVAQGNTLRADAQIMN
jgi:osmotically-inducible protein OsmY